MRPPAPKPNSVVADAIISFVQYKRALNRKYRSEASALGLFDGYLQQQQIAAWQAIDSVLIDRFLASRPRTRPRSYNHLRGVLARFFDWAVLHRVTERNPVTARPRRETKQRIPYLFDLSEARRLLELARAHGDIGSADTPLFSFTQRGCVHEGTISQTFHALVPKLQLCIPPGVSYPTVHCLRHSFAVGTLQRWYREGIDPNQRLIHLATFLGHCDPSSTAVYLTVTEELLRQADKRFHAFAPKGDMP